MLGRLAGLTSAIGLAIGSAALDTSSDKATIGSASTLASNIKSVYPTTNGLLGQPYPSWISASLLDTQLRHWHYTGDDQYTSQIASAITSNAGSNGDFLGPGITGNDDQLWWALAAMSAAEYNLPSPSGTPWLQLATTVFNQVISRWDASTCSGGIPWQISSSSGSGYTYKNSISNGLAFQLAARLARHTGKNSYATWATKIFKWSLDVGLIDKSTYAVYDGTDGNLNCAEFDHTLWTYNSGVYLYGAAIMQSVGDTSRPWQSHVSSFLQAATRDFTTSDILQETCETSTTKPCNTDQTTFKSHLAAWLGLTTALLPNTADQINKILDASSRGALAACRGGKCGMRWTVGRYDGKTGVGQDMGALEVVQALLAGQKVVPPKAGASESEKGSTGVVEDATPAKSAGPMKSVARGFVS